MTPLLAQHPAVASEAVSEHSRSGGSTFHPVTGENMSGRNLWAVGSLPEASHISESAPTPEEYSQFASNHSGLLSRHPNTAVGTHVDPDSGLHHMDVVATFGSKNAALDHAVKMGERSIYNLQTGQSVPTGAQRDVIPSSPDERFASARTAEPQKQPYSGVHFSDAKLDKIEGARRGASGAGAESARLHTGSGAPPGFYTYDSGTLPEPQMSQRKFSYPVKGNMAFAPTDHPEFAQAAQGELAKSGDPASALNAGEHALRDAGFDGYFNPAHPGTKFIFGDHTPLQSKYVPPQREIAPQIVAPKGEDKAKEAPVKDEEKAKVDVQPEREAQAEPVRESAPPEPERFFHVRSNGTVTKLDHPLGVTKDSAVLGVGPQGVRVVDHQMSPLSDFDILDKYGKHLPAFSVNRMNNGDPARLNA